MPDLVVDRQRLVEVRPGEFAREVVTSTTATDAATVTRVAPNATVGLAFDLAASNAARNGLLVFNDTTGTLSIRYGAGATATDFTVRLAAGAYWEMPDPIYTGVVTGSCSVATGGIQVTAL